MEAFTLDTSGGVALPVSRIKRNTLWSDLSPFAQGYVEALFASFERWPSTTFGDAKYPALPNASGEGVTIGLGFSSLAPATLAAILKDCGEYCASCGNPRAAQDDADLGKQFWLHRDAVSLPVLAPYLDGTGKVRLREAGQ